MQSAQQDENVFLREYINRGKLMQIATLDSDNRPWLVHVWYAADPQLHFIYTSNVARVHSNHIKANPAIAGGIIAMDLEGLGQEVQGVTFTGNAHECTGEELDQAYETYAARWQMARQSFPLPQIRTGESAMRMYKITPIQFVLFDEKNYKDQPKRVIDTW